LEIEGLHKVQLRLSNTFHDAFHMRGIGFHVPPRNNSGNFAGLVVDYHTSSGYSKRVRLAAGVLHAKCSSPHPDYGKPGLADETRDLGASLIETPEATFSLDIERHAPDGWDGRVWLSVGSDWIASDRRLTLEILAANDDVSGEFLEGIDPKALRVAYDERRTIEAQRSASGIVIDGSLGEDAWIGAGTTDEFYLIGGAGISSATTTARVAYDGEQLYVGFVCAEPGRRKPLIKGGPAWGDDVVEVWIDANGDEKTFRQVIVNAACDKMEYWDTGPGPIGATAATSLVEGESWSVEMAIPYEGLGVEAPSPGDIWRVSLCRSRPAGRGFGSELIVWAPLQEKGYGDLANFGVLRFR
ncbi:MAG TPA: carbohydrate-binding family 9-like protein, partial [Armatimonadota bacterium]|nr:carbohydrate-binding family 9-like protein [Armatimonadota bacterium]